MFTKNLYEIVGWDTLTPLNPKMWSGFGSAPFMITGNSHKKMLDAHKQYGARGMNEIFGDRFSTCYHLIHGIHGAISLFDEKWKENKRKLDLKATVFTSPYKSLDDIEDNVVVKKILLAAIDFYLDTTKDFEERVKVFTKHGKSESYIFEPTDPALKKIFKVFTESDIDRHSTIESADVVEHWVENLIGNRCELNWSNPYHPKIDRTKRNYIPSDIAIQRLRKYYIEKLFLEEIGSFEFDW